MVEEPKKPLSVILAVMVLSHTVTSLGNLSIPPLTPFLRDEMQLTHAQVGMFMSFIYIGVVSASIFFGWLTDFLGERRIIIMGLGIQGVFLIGFAGVHSFLLGLFLLLISGIGYSSVNPATTKGVMRWFPPQGRATAMGVKQTGIPLGGILAASFLPGLALSFGWRLAVVLVGAITLISIWVVRIAMPSTPPSHDQGPGKGWGQLRQVLTNRSMLALSIMGIFTAGAQLSIGTHLVLFLKTKFLFSSVLAGFYLAILQAGGFAGRIGWGLISDFLARGRRRVILVIIGGIAVLQLLLLSRIGPEISSWLFFIFIGLLGSTTFGFHGVFFGLIGEIVSK
jgi:sugar phosphate permease